MSPNFELIAAILGDYHDLQADGIVEAANRFPLGAVEEQIQLLSQLEAAGNATLANRIAELEREVSMHRNAEITWEKTMMQAVGEDGPKSVVEAFDKIKAERDAFADRLEDAENQYSELHNINSALAAQLILIRNIFRDESLSASETLRKIPFVIDLTLEQCLTELRAQAGRAGFVACIKLAYELHHPPGTIHANQYADSIRQEGK